MSDELELILREQEAAKTAEATTAEAPTTTTAGRTS